MVQYYALTMRLNQAEHFFPFSSGVFTLSRLKGYIEILILEEKI